MRKVFQVANLPFLFVLGFAVAVALITAKRASEQSTFQAGPAWRSQSYYLEWNGAPRPPQAARVFVGDNGIARLLVPEYQRVLFHEPRAATVQSISAEIYFDEDDDVVDLLLGYEKDSAYCFRISRQGVIPSGLFRIRDMKADKSEIRVIPQDKVPTSPPFRVRLEHQNGQVQAFFNDDAQPAATLPAREPPLGTVGFKAPRGGHLDFSVRRASVEWTDKSGQAHTFSDDFKIVRNKTPILATLLRTGARVFPAWALLSLLIFASVRISPLAAARKAGWGYLPIGGALPLFSNPANGTWLLALILAATYLVTLIRNRSSIRWHVSSTTNRKPATARRVVLCVVGLAILGMAVPLALGAAGHIPPRREAQSLLASREHQITVGQPVALGRVVKGFDLKAQLELLENSTLELAFRLRTDKDTACDWYALRLTTGATRPKGTMLPEKRDEGCGFVKSFGAERDGKPFAPPLVPEQSYSLEVSVRGGCATARLDGKLLDTFDVSDLDTGEVFLVQRAGVSLMDNLSFVPRTISFWDGGWGKLLAIGLALAGLPLAALLFATILSRITTIPFAPTLTFQFLTILPFHLSILLATFVNTSRWEFFWWTFFPLAALVLWFFLNTLFLMANRDRARGYSLLMLLLLPAIAVAAEFAARQSPLGYYGRGNWQGGYVRDEFIMTPLQMWLVRPSYFRAPKVRGLKFPVDKPEKVTRILCLGGSTTVGLGANQEVHSYPAYLERMLKKASREVEVINGGYVAFASMDVLLYFDRDLARFQPDVIVLRSGVNDYFATPSPLSQREQWDAIREGKGQTGPDALVRNSRLLFSLARAAAQARRAKGVARATPEEFGENVKKLVEYTKAKNIRLILVEEVREPALVARNLKESITTGQLRALANKKNPHVQYVRTADVLLRDNGFDILFVDNLHMTKRGNELIAEAITKAFLNQ